MTDSGPVLRPDARLVRLHAERGDPHARLAGALADLEGAEWGVLLSGPDALARQLAALLGAGTLRVDGRLRLEREALAGAGLAVAGLDGEWRGARAVWLLEPNRELLERARRAAVRVIVDGTLAPGGGWFQAGADLLVYRDSVTLTGHGDAPLAALFGLGRAPQALAPAPSDLSVGLALRDVATLPLRLARAARTTAQLLDRLGGAAQAVGPTAVLLAPDAAPDTPAGLGGVVAAARSVAGGVLLTPGLDDVELALSLVHDAQGRDEGADRPVEWRPAPLPAAPEPRAEGGRPAPGFVPGRDARRDAPRRERERGGRRDEGRRDEGRRGERPNQPTPPSQPDVPERFTFDAPDHLPDGLEADPLFPAVAPGAAAVAEETWEPEIVFSDIAQEQVRLPTPVSSGPDAPNLGDIVPNVRFVPEERQSVQDAEPEPAGITAPALAPDLPVELGAGGKDDPAANLTDEQAAIFARLREWRNAEAKRQEISRFIIASNATLAEIARRVPYTDADLKAVKGMGPERMKKYGASILEVVRG